MIVHIVKCETVAKKYYRVTDLMERQGCDLEQLARHTGLETQVIEAIARQRYANAIYYIHGPI